MDDPLRPPAAIQDHVVWIEDSIAAAVRLGIADRHQTAGIAAWRLGQEDARVWAILREWKGIR